MNGPALRLAILFFLALFLAVLLVRLSAEAPPNVIEDWAKLPVGGRGVPAGWSRYATPGGHPRYEFTVVEDEGRKALRLDARDEHSTIVKEVKVDLRATPILEWSWKVVALPHGADVRTRETSDATGHILLVWPRVPAMLRSRLIGYIWDPVAPLWTMQRSAKTRLVTFFVVRSGPVELNRWVVERRDVGTDYRAAFGEEPEAPRAVAISIDTNDTHSTAETLIGSIAFTGGAVGGAAR